MRARNVPIVILSGIVLMTPAAGGAGGPTAAGNPSYSEKARNGDLLVMAGVAFHA